MIPVRTFCFTLFISCSWLVAASGDEGPSKETIRAAVTRTLPLLESSARVSAERRRCFTCHNEGLPMLVFTEARRRGFAIDGNLPSTLSEHTAAHLKRGKSNYLKGIGQGGKADTAGSALWALHSTGYPRDEITDAVVDFLVQWNDDTPYWQAQSNRPPSEGSRFTSTFLALRGFESYRVPEKREAIEARRSSARQWLIETVPDSTEDRVFRLRALQLAQANPPDLANAAELLKTRQRDDGGWSQLDDLDSDAYATGTALAALHDTGRMAVNDPAYRRGLAFLLDSQRADGSWHVESRSRPIQEPYESGFPHGEDQFISAAATSWATLSLLYALPESPGPVSNSEKQP